MAVERSPSGSSLIDVLDRVLDKGIVIDAWVRVSLVGIDLVTIEARIVVASIDTYLKYSEAVGLTAPGSRPRELSAGGADEREPRAHSLAENGSVSCSPSFPKRPISQQPPGFSSHSLRTWPAHGGRSRSPSTRRPTALQS